jgi:hypothetical protein
MYGPGACQIPDGRGMQQGTGARATAQLKQRTPDHVRRRAEQCTPLRQRARHHQQRRHDHHQQHVLHHVQRTAGFGPIVEGPEEGQPGHQHGAVEGEASAEAGALPGRAEGIGEPRHHEDGL